jgi:hypothetical protein
MPHWEQGLQEVLMRRWYGDDWDAPRGVVYHGGKKKLRAGVASIAEADLVEPHIRFVHEANPRRSLRRLSRRRASLPLQGATKVASHMAGTP